MDLMVRQTSKEIKQGTMTTLCRWKLQIAHLKRASRFKHRGRCLAQPMACSIKSLQTSAFKASREMT